MPASNSLAISKFLGKNRYEYYVQELTGYGTIGGTQLTPAQRKQAFVIRNNKIKFEKFVDGFLNKKSAAIKAIGPGGTPGPKSGAIVKSPGGSVQKYMQTQQQKFADGAEDQNLSDILNKIDEILKSLKEEQKTKDASSEFDRKKKEKEKRDLLKSKLKKRFEGLKKAAEKVLAPVKNILQKIIDFILTIFIGRFVYKLLEWWGDPANKSKVNSIIRFFGDHWPKLLALYIAFGTSLGRFALGLTRAVARGAVSLLAKILLLSRAKKLRDAGKFLGRGRGGKLLANIIGTGAALGGAYALTQGLKGNEDQKTQGLSGGGFVIPKFSGGGFNFSSLLGGLSGMFGFGAPSGGGFVSGEKGIDKVPAMLSDGEFVMSRGAVAEYGLDTLEAMNAAGGGTNKPKMISGTAFAAGGGLIGKDKTATRQASPPLSGNSKLAYDTMRLNFPSAKPYHIAGALANFETEAPGLKPNTYQIGGGPGRGIAQWETPGRWDTATKMFGPGIINNLNQQLAYVKYEMDTGNPDSLGRPQLPFGRNTKSTWLGSKNLIDATTNFMNAYESPGILHLDKRLANAQRIMGSINSAISVAKTNQSKDKPNPLQQFGSAIKSGVMNLFGQPAQARPTKPEKYGTGGYAPKMPEFSSARPRNNITPLPRKNPSISSVAGMNLGGGGGYSIPSDPSGTIIPPFDVALSGNDRSNKMKTLGIM